MLFHDAGRLAIRRLNRRMTHGFGMMFRHFCEAPRSLDSQTVMTFLGGISVETTEGLQAGVEETDEGFKFSRDFAVLFAISRYRRTRTHGRLPAGFVVWIDGV